MSLADLLPAIRALPRAEKAELLHLLVDDVTAPPVADDGVTGEMRKLLPPSGAVVDFVWPTTIDSATHATLNKVLAALNEGKALTDIEGARV